MTRESAFIKKSLPVSMNKAIRCVIYTRKSSEEGLEQEFNSLHAQREACESYIKSQKHEGWELLPAHYDDGGYSGGNIDRPALKQLMQDIDAGLVDVIVVYKVDRLTRSLADFAKIVEKMDTKGVSFVSVTQQFNTTSSMGRLTLNVLLSFAQFEREVTGERIRDKIALSKTKGKWMGGMTPTGYDCIDHKLIVSKPDALLIQHIFARYLALESISLLKNELDAEGYKTKYRKSKAGRDYGGLSFTKSNLARILQNRVYIGEIPHKGKWHAGHHEGIIDQEIFEKAQQMLSGNRVKRSAAIGTKSPCLLAGKLFDDQGNYMTPKHSRTRKRHYRYYTSQAIIQGKPDEAGSLPNIPAHEIEILVKQEIQKFLKDRNRLYPIIEKETIDRQNALFAIATNLTFENTEKERLFLRSIIGQVTLSSSGIQITLCADHMLAQLKIQETARDEQLVEEADLVPNNPIVLTCKAILKAARNGSKVIIGDHQPDISSQGNAYLIKAIAKAHLWNQQLITGEVKTMQEIADRENIKSQRYVRKVMNLQFLAPDITESILNGNARHLTFAKLTETASIPDWNEQRKALVA